MKIGITGQNGFVGSHLYNTLGLFPDEFERIEFRKEFFEDQEALETFVRQCEVIVHLAAMNRHESEGFIYETNITLANRLIMALEHTDSKAHIVFSSSSQEEKDNLYGKSKKEGRVLFKYWAERKGGTFTGLIIPNVFGPFGKPNYNSFIATFCHKLTHNQEPEIQQDGEVGLIYVGELVQKILQNIRIRNNEAEVLIHPSGYFKVSEILAQLNLYKKLYLEKGEIPALRTEFDYQLFNTFRSYIDLESHFPVNFKQHTDDRGAFVEIIRLGIGGQCSFSTTVPGITRGNHFHTRKIERFAVIRGKALIQMRKVNTAEVFNFYLDGQEPAYVDMPIWYTHNIKNIGEEDLYTIFWINEAYNPDDADTYFESV